MRYELKEYLEVNNGKAIAFDWTIVSFGRKANSLQLVYVLIDANNQPLESDTITIYLNGDTITSNYIDEELKKYLKISK
jgi:uncharacterized protein YeaC (DUF1315 family)